jgi:Tfp pilus assembly protein PilO
MEKQWNVLIKKIQQPKTMLILVFLLGFLINGGIYLYKITPQFLPMHNLSDQYNQLEKQRNSLEKLPIPEKILPAEIDKVIEQVPISVNTAAFLLKLKELETQSGVQMELVSDGSNTKIGAANAPTTSEGKANLPNTQPKTTESANSIETKSTTATGSEANFDQHDFEVTIVGQYVQLMDFINRLKDLPRFVNVKEWQFGDGSSGLSAPLLQVIDTPDKKRIKLTLSIYSATQFKDKFPDLPPVSITRNPDHRLDPTISDDQFNKLLESP